MRTVPATPDAIRRIAQLMLEDQLEENVRQLCASLGLLYYHTRDSRRSPEGYPDCAIANPRGGYIVRELKRQREQPTPAQQGWLDALTWSGIDAGVWRPVDLLDKTIARELVALAGGSSVRGRPLIT